MQRRWGRKGGRGPGGIKFVLFTFRKLRGFTSLYSEMKVFFLTTYLKFVTMQTEQKWTNQQTELKSGSNVQTSNEILNFLRNHTNINA